MAEPPPSRIPLVLVKPPKPLADMTDAELDAFADRIFEAAKQNFDRR